jgi:glycosyltransferase involved in cell wall biosynthesis
MKMAIVHDSISQYGGAEKVLEEMHAAFPTAPVFLGLWKPNCLPERFRDWDIRTSWLDRLPGARRYHRAVFPLYPCAMHSLDLTGFDVVLSSSFNFAHNVVTGPDAVHVCYCHSPGRFLWDFPGYAERERLGRVTRGVAIAMLPWLRALDTAAAQRVDHWISTSRLVQQRISKYYRRDSIILPPPIRVADFHAQPGRGEYFLLLMRLVGWKRADIIIEACNRLGLPLVVAGDGRDEARLRSLAGPTVRFAGRIDGAEKAAIYARSIALILPSVEDFGITPLEAMASGRPVIALREGGALDTVRPGVTGEFFASQTADSVAETLRGFRPERYDPEVIRAHAETYDAVAFRAQLRDIVQGALARQRGGPAPFRVTGRRPAEASPDHAASHAG